MAILSVICLIAMALSFVFLPPFAAIFHALGFPVAFWIAWSDFEKYRIPLAALVLSGALGLGFLFHQTRIFETAGNLTTLQFRLVLAILITGGFWLFNLMFKKLRGRTGLAEGDVILFGISALWVTPENYPVFMMTACVSALIVVLVRQRMRKRSLSRDQMVPFGAFIAFSTWGCALI